MLTGAGQLHIGAIDRVARDEIAEADARRAGDASRDVLLAELAARVGTMTGAAALWPDLKVRPYATRT